MIKEVCYFNIVNSCTFLLWANVFELVEGVSIFEGVVGSDHDETNHHCDVAHQIWGFGTIHQDGHEWEYNGHIYGLDENQLLLLEESSDKADEREYTDVVETKLVEELEHVILPLVDSVDFYRLLVVIAKEVHADVREE